MDHQGRITGLLVRLAASLTGDAVLIEPADRHWVIVLDEEASLSFELDSAGCCLDITVAVGPPPRDDGGALIAGLLQSAHRWHESDQVFPALGDDGILSLTLRMAPSGLDARTLLRACHGLLSRRERILEAIDRLDPPHLSMPTYSVRHG